MSRKGFSLNNEGEQIITTLSNSDKIMSVHNKSRAYLDRPRPSTKILTFEKSLSHLTSNDDKVCESDNCSHCSLSICDSESCTETSSIISDDKVLEAFEYEWKIGSKIRPRPSSSKKAKRLKKLKNQNISGAGEASFRPNYFVGIQISNPDIHKAVIDIQKSLLESDINFMPSLIDVATLHLTLLVAHIQNDDQLFEACSALDHCGAILSEELLKSPIQLSFHGISNFSNKTIFAKLVEDDHFLKLQKIGQIVTEKFYEMNIMMPQQRSLVPHLTIAKLSKISKCKGKPVLRKIDPIHYQQFLNYEFGIQVISGIQLLSMNKPKDKNRYYFNSRQVSFDVVPVESLDHTGCCLPRQPQISKLQKTNSSRDNFSSYSNDSIIKVVLGGAAIMSMVFIITKATLRLVGS